MQAHGMRLERDNFVAARGSAKCCQTAIMGVRSPRQFMQFAGLQMGYRRCEAGLATSFVFGAYATAG
jgi:hypothetical protein